MSKEKREIKMKVTKTEKTFLEYCRKVRYAEGRIFIMDGVAVKLLNPVKSIRFDLSTESPLEESMDDKS